MDVKKREEVRSLQIQTVLFDLDGTLIDTNELIIASFEHTFKEFGYSFTREQIKEFNGPPLWETFYSINPDQAELMVRVYREHNHANHEQYVKLFPNVIETLETLKKHQINIGIVTAKMRDGVTLGMSITGLDRYADTVITFDDVRHSKPHPEPVFKALDKLKASAQTTIMVGDNYHDIEAGKRAGTFTAGVAWSHKGREFLESYEPNYMLEDMTDLLDIVGV